MQDNVRHNDRENEAICRRRDEKEKREESGRESCQKCCDVKLRRKESASWMAASAVCANGSCIQSSNNSSCKASTTMLIKRLPPYSVVSLHLATLAARSYDASDIDQRADRPQHHKAQLA